MQVTIGKAQAEVSKDGRTVDFAPPPGSGRAWEIPGFSGTSTSAVRRAEEGAAKPASSTVAAPASQGVDPTAKAIEFAGSLGPGLLFASLVLGFAFHRFAKSGERLRPSPARGAGNRSTYDQAADRHAFLKRYGGDN